MTSAPHAESSPKWVFPLPKSNKATEIRVAFKCSPEEFVQLKTKFRNKITEIKLSAILTGPSQTSRRPEGAICWSRSIHIPSNKNPFTLSHVLIISYTLCVDGFDRQLHGTGSVGFCFLQHSQNTCAKPPPPHGQAQPGPLKSLVTKEMSSASSWHQKISGRW